MQNFDVQSLWKRHIQLFKYYTQLDTNTGLNQNCACEHDDAHDDEDDDAHDDAHDEEDDEGEEEERGPISVPP